MQRMSSRLAGHSLQRNEKTDSTFYGHLSFHSRKPKFLGSGRDTELRPGRSNGYEIAESPINPAASWLKDIFGKWSREEAEESSARVEVLGESFQEDMRAALNDPKLDVASTKKFSAIAHTNDERYKELVENYR